MLRKFEKIVNGAKRASYTRSDLVTKGLIQATSQDLPAKLRNFLSFLRTIQVEHELCLEIEAFNGLFRPETPDHEPFLFITFAEFCKALFDLNFAYDICLVCVDLGMSRSLLSVLYSLLEHLLEFDKYPEACEIILEMLDSGQECLRTNVDYLYVFRQLVSAVQITKFLDIESPVAGSPLEVSMETLFLKTRQKHNAELTTNYLGDIQIPKVKKSMADLIKKCQQEAEDLRLLRAANDSEERDFNFGLDTVIQGNARRTQELAHQEQEILEQIQGLQAELEATTQEIRKLTDHNAEIQDEINLNEAHFSQKREFLAHQEAELAESFKLFFFVDSFFDNLGHDVRRITDECINGFSWRAHKRLVSRLSLSVMKADLDRQHSGHVDVPRLKGRLQNYLTHRDSYLKITDDREFPEPRKTQKPKLVVPKANLQAFFLATEGPGLQCFDCPRGLTEDSAWASLSYGIYVCTSCAQTHRQLGRPVKSLASDNFTNLQFARLQKGGNARFREFLKTLPSDFSKGYTLELRLAYESAVHKLSAGEDHLLADNHEWSSDDSRSQEEHNTLKHYRLQEEELILEVQKFLDKHPEIPPVYDHQNLIRFPNLDEPLFQTQFLSDWIEHS